MIARAPIIDTKSNLKLTQKCIDRVYLSWQCDVFNIETAFICQILLKIFMDINAYEYVKHRKSVQDSQAAFFDVHKQFLGPDYVARKAVEAE